MKKNTFTIFALCLFTLFAFQAQAQYTGVAYLGNTPQIGETIGVPVTIELENYDALADDPSGDGANYGAAASPLTAGATYWDKSSGGSDAGNPIRTSSDVDLEADATGAVVSGAQGQEFTVYTVNVVTAGIYHMGVNYKHGGSSKDIRLESFNVNGENRIDLFNTLDMDGLPPTDGEYITTDNLGSFELPAGPLLLKFNHLDAGPRFDYFTLTLDEEIMVGNPDYSGVAYQGNVPQLGETVGTPVQVEFENFDALSDAPDGDGANFNNDADDIPVGELGTYYDDSPGGSEDGNPVRADSDVDIKAAGTGAVVSDVKPGEYTIYTVNVVNPGIYHMGVNYKHGGTSKDIKVYTHNVDGGDKTVIYDSTPDEGLPVSDYETTDNLGSFELAAGPLLIRIRTLDTGPSFDFFTVTLDEIISSTENELLEANALKVSPNPAINGVFNVNTEDEWSVYSLSGAQVLQGKGNRVDLSNFAKGVYILKTPYTSTKLISK